MKRRSGWEKYFAEGADAAAELFRDDNLLTFVRNLQPLFIEHGVQYMVAPYLAAPQLAWFNDPQQNMVQAVYAGLDLLPYCPSVQKIVTEINFTVCPRGGPGWGDIHWTSGGLTGLFGPL